ncbi:hypothetical protein MES4922_110153 [Mesorhizobium ventifaucium]|uniref:Uncharacterized protein n=1 Tax=Mesorhizobium ventifaucium TaxID=666020 RepID=A0ABN8J9A0_9HYPH|nr:hypothetical protein MES4922_110153 [Mesorhizobium ventifaucium]
MAEDRRDVDLLAVTSADRLNAGWTAASRARERGLVHARSHETIGRSAAPLRDRLRHRWPSGITGLAGVGPRPRTRSLGVEHFGQSGTIDDLYRHFGI